MPHLLIVDADNAFRTTLSRAIKGQAYRVTGLTHPDLLTSALAINRPDLVLLELHYPDADSDGIRACALLREWNPVPVIIISTRSDEHLKVQALDAGADDFLVKPFGVEELMARVRAILRRATSPVEKDALSETPTPLIKIRDLTIDLDYRSVWQGGKPLHLTRKEYSLFRLLVLAHGRLVTYEKIVGEVWGKPANAVERMAARALIKQLRRKLGEDSTNPTYLLTEPGVGYRLNVTHG